MLRLLLLLLLAHSLHKEHVLRLDAVHSLHALGQLPHGSPRMQIFLGGFGGTYPV